MHRTMRRTLPFRILVPLLCMGLLITSCTLNGGFLQVIARAANQNATLTSTPSAQLSGITERIRFNAGETSAQVSGFINGSTVNTYLVNAQAGQHLRALLSSPYSNVYLTVISPNGTPLARAQNGAQGIDQTITASGDYTFQISAPVNTATTTYILNVSVTSDLPTQAPPPTNQRIRFAAGATSAQVNGQVSGTTYAGYVIEARAGQIMQISVASANNGAYLTLVSPSGSPLARAQAGAQSFSGTLPENGDYAIQISAPAGTPLTNYTLNVSITGGQPQPTAIPGQPGNQRIRFAAGATSAQVSGQIDGTVAQGYLLEAQAGQHMTITLVSSGSNAYIDVVSPQGSPLARAQAGAQSFDMNLPESGDYLIRVSAPVGTPTISYTLTVSVTSGDTGTITQRIRFAAGATSAQVTGQISGLGIATYLLEAQAGQYMQVTLTSPAGSAYLNVVAPDGSPLARAQAGAQSYYGTLPVSGDYQLQVMLLENTAQTAYTLTVTVTGAQPQPTQSAPQRIRFAAGATSAQVSGQVSETTLDNYLLEARAGQTMTITLNSTGNGAYLTLVSPQGSPLARAMAGAQSFSGTLPENGDYRITVSAPAGTPLINYTLTVSVTG